VLNRLLTDVTISGELSLEIDDLLIPVHFEHLDAKNQVWVIVPNVRAVTQLFKLGKSLLPQSQWPEVIDALDAAKITLTIRFLGQDVVSLGYQASANWLPALLSLLPAEER
jgi:hypothetical protein